MSEPRPDVYNSGNLKRQEEESRNPWQSPGGACTQSTLQWTEKPGLIWRV